MALFGANSLGELIGRLHCVCLKGIEEEYSELPIKHGVDQWFRIMQLSASYTDSIPEIASLASVVEAYDFLSVQDLGEGFSLDGMFEVLTRFYTMCEIQFVLHTAVGVATDKSFDAIIEHLAQNYIDRFAIIDLMLHIEPLCDRLLSIDDATFEKYYNNEIARQPHDYQELQLTSTELLDEMRYVLKYLVKTQDMHSTAIGVYMSPKIMGVD